MKAGMTYLSKTRDRKELSSITLEALANKSGMSIKPTDFFCFDTILFCAAWSDAR